MRPSTTLTLVALTTLTNALPTPRAAKVNAAAAADPRLNNHERDILWLTQTLALTEVFTTIGTATFSISYPGAAGPTSTTLAAVTTSTVSSAAVTSSAASVGPAPTLTSTSSSSSFLWYTPPTTPWWTPDATTSIPAATPTPNPTTAAPNDPAQSTSTFLWYTPPTAPWYTPPTTPWWPPASSTNTPSFLTLTTPTPQPTTSTPTPTPTPTPQPLSTPYPSLNLPPTTPSSQYTGDLTYYTPGLGSCGLYSLPNDPIVAISHVIMEAYSPPNPNNNPLCGRTVQITFGGQVWNATVVDTCEGCAEGSVDLAEGFFGEVTGGQWGVGRFHGVQWVWA